MRKEQMALPMAVIGTLVAAGFAVTLAILSPDKGRTAWIGGLMLPILWGAVELFSKADKREVRHAVAIAAALIALALGVKVAQAAGWGWFGPDQGKAGARLVGICGGLVMAYFGNRIPKILERFDLRIDAARRQAFQRHAGWIIVLSGLSSALAWAVLPMGGARFWGTMIIAGGMALVVARLVQCRLRGKRA